MEGYDQTQEEIGTWAATISIAEFNLFLRCEINMDSYPYDYPVVTIRLNENMYDLVCVDLSKTEKKKLLRNCQTKLDETLENLKVFKENQSVFQLKEDKKDKNDEEEKKEKELIENTKRFFSIEGVYDKNIDSEDMKEEDSNICEVEQVVPYLCHILNMIGLNIQRELRNS